MRLTLGHALSRRASSLQERGDKKDSKKAKVERDETESEDDEVEEMDGKDEEEGTVSGSGQRAVRFPPLGSSFLPSSSSGHTSTRH